MRQDQTRVLVAMQCSIRSAASPSLARGWLAGAILLLGACAAHAQRITPYVPANDGVVLQRVPPSTDPRVRQFDQLRVQAGRSPQDIEKAVALAKAYVDYGRSTGDARYLGRAMAVIAPFMQVNPPPISVLLVHATIQQSRHAFDASRVELDRILKRDPGNAQAWLTLATVAMVQGDYATANRSCVKLANASSDFMGIVCTASLRSLDGHARQAYALLTLVQDPGPKAPAAIRAWLEGLLADTAARMGKAELADGHFRRALQWTPGDNFLLADYGEFLLDQGRAREALQLVQDDTQSDTSFLVRVAAEVALNLPQARDDIAQMDARFQAMEQRGDHVFLREQASYLLHVKHQPAQALALATRNWSVQRAPKDVRIYLEAAIASHDLVAARRVLDFVRTTGMADVVLDPLLREANTLTAVPATASATVSKAAQP